jgi:hypothetical protein
VILEELAPTHRHVEHHDRRFGEDGAIELDAILANGRGRDLGFVGWETTMSRVACGGSEMKAGDLEKKNHTAM